MKTKDRTIITTPSNEPLSTSEQSLTRRAATVLRVKAVVAY
jgi:hypothetical protein